MRALQNEGVKTIFGYPGGAIMPTFDALYDYTRGDNNVFNHILVRHEQAAAHAAEGFSRVSGEVGVCIVTSGPGATNTLTGIADAMIDSTPIVVIAGQVGTEALGTDAFQEVDFVGMTQPITKWSYQIRRPEDISWAVSRAFYIARSGRPGPVVLDFPKSAQVQKCEWRPVKVTSVRSYEPYPHIQDDHVAAAASLINRAERPLALVGHGVELGGAQEELRQFLEKADIPAARTMLGLSALPTDHPLNMGMLGMHGNLAPNVLTQKADVIIAIGMRFSDRDTGRLDTYAKQAKIIHLDIDNVEIDKVVKTDVSVVGDCKVSLPAITRLLNKNSHREWIDSFRPYWDEERRRVIEPAIHPTEGPLLMGEVVNVVAEASHGEAVLVNDVGQNQLFSCRYFHYRRKLSVVTSGGLGTMGFGLGAAIGAKTGNPDKTVVNMAGDGSFAMNLNELITASAHGINIVEIVINNNVLGMVRQWQRLFYSKHFSETTLDARHIDYVKLGEAFGIKTFVIEKTEEIAPVLREALEISKSAPVMIEVRIDRDINVLPMIPAGKPVVNPITSIDLEA